MTERIGFTVKNFYDYYAGDISIDDYIEQIKYVQCNVPAIGMTTYQFEEMKLLLNKVLPIVTKFKLPAYSGTPRNTLPVSESKWAGDTSMTVSEGLMLAMNAIEQSKLNADLKDRLHTEINRMACGDWSDINDIAELWGILQCELTSLYHGLSVVVNNIPEIIKNEIGDYFTSKPEKKLRRKVRHRVKKVVISFIDNIQMGCPILLNGTVEGVYMSVFVSFMRDSFRYPGDKHEFTHSDPFCKILDTIETSLLRICDFALWITDKHRFSFTNSEVLYVAREYYDNHSHISNQVIFKPKNVDEMFTDAMATFYRNRDVYKAIADEFDYEELIDDRDNGDSGMCRDGVDDIQTPEYDVSASE